MIICIACTLKDSRVESSGMTKFDESKFKTM